MKRERGLAGGANPCAMAPHDRLPAHEGHPTAAATCVDTTFGELSAQENNPTLLIVAAPTTVKPGQDIALQVSVRNLVRDQFPASAPDLVELHLSGRDAAGQPLFPAGALVHCAAWAGDGSHRIPMDAFADQVPAFDAVRITVAS